VKRLTGDAAARENLKVARLSVGTATALGLMKLAAAILTGSLSIVASLLDSVMDVLASTVNLFAVRVAGQPADEDHAYGHGKAEGLAGLVQGVVVGFSGGYLLVEGIRRLMTGEGIARADVGIAVMVVSTFASLWITWKLRRTAKKTGSVAVAADAVHYASDVWTNLGVLLALVVIRATDWQWVDVLVASAVALVVLWTAVRVVLQSTHELMDRVLPEEEVGEILAAIRKAVPEVRGIHDLRTRRAGPIIFVDLHVQFDRDLTFVKAHRKSEQVVLAVKQVHPGAEVHVHADPFPLYPSDLG
jgi:ferrous-iron efflux pump FieF